MNTTPRAALSLLLLLAALPPGPVAEAQTVQGDILRGQGRYLAGAGWYNLSTARAGRINVETWKSYNREVQRLYRDYMIDRSRRIRAGKDLTNKLQADYQRKFEEDQRRWREDPTPADISSGDALNALAGDLADPSIDPSTWRAVRVDLPPELTLTALAFKIADPKKSRLQQSTVAIDRMLIKDRWPLPFRRPEIGRECASYEKAIGTVVDKCRKGAELQASDYDGLRNSVAVLQKAVETAIPSRDDQRRQARDYVRRLDETTKIFAEQAYAEQLVRDVTEHKATTVAELLAFMRDYRLLFADPGNSPEVTSLYEGLYGLLRRQKDMLGIRAPQAASDVFTAGSVWDNGDRARPINLRVADRQGGQFRAIFSMGKDRVSEINGQVGADTISWGPDDVRFLQGGPQGKAQAKAQFKKAQAKAQFKKAQAKAQFKAKAQGKPEGGEMVGRFKGNEIEFSGHPRLGNFVLRKTR